ncbi:MAG: 3-hydroxyanthranilate 3,4-dioxygenase [Flavobacteriales bacterium]|nr:3-hydroxyanthranilate 3,4-dioxygenase [Flavobacteriales bacterium]
MSVISPFNFKKWIEENRSLLKPPIGNQCVYKEAENFIVMVVGGPNARKDYHYNESEELYYQVEGDITVGIMENGKPVDINIKEGEIFLLPPKVPHSPRRPKNTIGVVLEKIRDDKDKDGLMWFCENCNEKLYEEYFHLDDIVAQFPPIMSAYYADEEKCTCKSCGTIMAPPA